MKFTKAILVVIALCFVSAGTAWGQTKDWWNDPERLSYMDHCPSLYKLDMAGVLSALDGYKVSVGNGDCVMYAILRIGDAKYQPAIPTLIRFLDFHKPEFRTGPGPTTRLSSIDAYPAAQALEAIGRPALPAVLRVIESDSPSVIMLHNSIEVWERADQQPHVLFSSLAGLRREQQKASDPGVKQRLDAIIREVEAETCVQPYTPDQIKVCRQAAETGTVSDQAPPTQQ